MLLNNYPFFFSIPTLWPYFIPLSIISCLGFCNNLLTDFLVSDSSNLLFTLPVRLISLKRKSDSVTLWVFKILQWWWIKQKLRCGVYKFHQIWPVPATSVGLGCISVFCLCAWTSVPQPPWFLAPPPSLPSALFFWIPVSFNIYLPLVSPVSVFWVPG